VSHLRRCRTPGEIEANKMSGDSNLSSSHKNTLVSQLRRNPNAPILRTSSIKERRGSIFGRFLATNMRFCRELQIALLAACANKSTAGGIAGGNKRGLPCDSPPLKSRRSGRSVMVCSKCIAIRHQLTPWEGGDRNGEMRRKSNSSSSHFEATV